MAKMTLQEIEDLWDLAGVLHRARIELAWGKGSRREPWPKFHRSYTHNPIAYVDLALAQAAAVVEHFKIDLAVSTARFAQQG